MVYGAGSPRVAGVAGAKNTQHDSGEPSWHCRSCMRETCVGPAVTICGHLFCHSCIIRELSQQAACPVCKMVFLVRLDVGKAKS
ncbi:hypothetical protein BD413DRAFT_1725 [Trametes elegans]|nr:hypothetical protein BD413DRAFT_1725 [Trametes elegans]